MSNLKPQILLTNDDGILSPGLWAAAASLSKLGFVTVTAPREQSSGAGRGLPSTSEGIIQEGPGYYLSDVPWVMFFYDEYGFHGTYWHDNFGAPMSRGCVNLRTEDAEWLYHWASVGTPVVVHY